jgi:glycosyltransferase involved in cell wall biosynthesis
MGSEAIGGLGAFAHDELLRRQAAYRFVFHPARWTSFGMAVCEAMLLGQPVVALSATEMPTVIVDGVNGFTSTDPARLEASMRALLEDRALAARLGDAGHETARERFSIGRFARDWNRVFEEAMDRAPTGGGA